MSHVFLKSEKSKKRYLEARRKTARTHSGSTITAKAFLRKQDKQNGTKTNSKNKA